MSVKPWKQLSKELVFKTVVFDLFKQRLQSPLSDYQDDFYYIEVVDWVNVVGITPTQEILLIEQYRFGTHLPSIELPGGMLHGTADTPEAAARRELQEETGYAAAALELLGVVHPNPAMQTNRAFTYLARDVEKVASQQLDAAEDIEVLLVPLREIPERIQRGEISHGLMVAAFFHYFAKYGFPS